QRFPAGRQISSAGEYAWSFESLPHLEHSSLFERFDRTKPWSDPRGNWDAAQTSLTIFRCPNGQLKFAGKTDYGGISGSSLVAVSGLDDGVLIEVGRKRFNYIRAADITDGTSHTIMVAEATDRAAGEAAGLWVSR